MDIGMLWFDDSPNSLNEKVVEAVGFYNKKYGREPTLCLVNPSMLEADEGVIAGIQVRRARSVLPGHFWIGVEEKAGAVQKESKRTNQRARATQPVDQAA
jgi:hypothetical protein